MNPTWQSDCGQVQLYLGDCRDILPHLGKVDCVIADPPYLVRAGNGGGVFGQRDHLVKTGGFTDGGCDFGFLSGFGNWFCFCSRNQLPELLAIAAAKPRWNLVTWCKPNPVPTCCNKYLPDVEYVVHGFEGGRLFGEMRYKSCFVNHPCGNSETDHPNEKPVDVVLKLVHTGTKENETILDPYMGSGTTGIACLRTGRKFIGIEVSPKYFEIAKERIQRELAQLKLPL